MAAILVLLPSHKHNVHVDMNASNQRLFGRRKLGQSRRHRATVELIIRREETRLAGVSHVFDGNAHRCRQDRSSSETNSLGIHCNIPSDHCPAWSRTRGWWPYRGQPRRRRQDRHYTPDLVHEIQLILQVKLSPDSEHFVAVSMTNFAFEIFRGRPPVPGAGPRRPRLDCATGCRERRRRGLSSTQSLLQTSSSSPGSESERCRSAQPGPILA